MNLRRILKHNDCKIHFDLYSSYVPLASSVYIFITGKATRSMISGIYVFKYQNVLILVKQEMNSPECRPQLLRNQCFLKKSVEKYVMLEIYFGYKKSKFTLT